MTKQEQIEEMAKIYCKNEFLCSKGCQTNGCRVYEVSEALYNAGYQKIDDDCAVITKDDLNLYKKQAVKEFAEKLKSRKFDKDMFNDFAGATYVVLVREIDELLKEYEVEK